MRIVIIGRGRLATNLERALLDAGQEVVTINSRTLEGLPMSADVYVIAVKDSVLKEVITAATKERESQVFVHTAGSMAMEVFQGKARHYGVLYPMQSFSKERPVDFKEIPTFIEASDAKTLETIRQLAERMTEHVHELPSEARQYLHLAAVFACNFVNHCYAMAAEVLEQHGMDFKVMLPLIDETARKVHQLHPLQAQTGPAVRYDENVIHHHHRLLQDHPIMRDLYEKMSQHIYQKAMTI